MASRAWYELDEDERRVHLAQAFLWLSCAGSLIALVILFVAIILQLGVVQWQGAEHPLVAVRSLVVLAMYVVAAILVGRRRRIGALIGLALFGYGVLGNAVGRHYLSFAMGWSILGVILVLRAMPAMRGKVGTP